MAQKQFKVAYEFLPPYDFTIYFLLDLMKRLESFGEQDWIDFQSQKPYKIEKYHVVP